jgi:UDP-glucose 4-epimerase
MVEQALEDYDIAYGLKAVALRYFNAAGADPLGRVGECHEPETHLIPLILQVAAQRREHIAVFGRDYPTEDGTAVRDYIHVADLCQAHSLALQHLLSGGDSRRYNLGNGLGFSVQEVIDTVRAVTLRDIKVIDQPRRAGDPARLIADARAIQQDLNWTPIYPSLNDIVAHAWGWELKWGRQQS